MLASSTSGADTTAAAPAAGAATASAAGAASAAPPGQECHIRVLLGRSSSKLRRFTALATVLPAQIAMIHYD